MIITRIWIWTENLLRTISRRKTISIQPRVGRVKRGRNDNCGMEKLMKFPTAFAFRKIAVPTISMSLEWYQWREMLPWNAAPTKLLWGMGG